MNQTVMPGNILANLPESIKLGPGLSRNFANDKVRYLSENSHFSEDRQFSKGRNFSENHHSLVNR